jgi:hypothetical protein
MSYTGREKRRHVRLPIDLQYRLVVDDLEYSGHMEDISLSGAYLASIEPEFPASGVSRQGVLNINTRNEWVEVSGEVVYRGSRSKLFPQGVGFAFSQEDEEIASVIWNISIQSLK